MSKNSASALNFRRPQADEGRIVFSTGAFGQQWKLRDDPARGLVYNPYVARAGEIRACMRMTAALVREGECVWKPPVRATVSDGHGGWNWAEGRAFGEGTALFIGPWITETRVGGTWAPLRPIGVARESTPEQIEAIEIQKALVGWLNSAADLAEEMKAAGDRLGLITLRKFFTEGVTGSGTGPNSPYCSHVSMDQVVGQMSPARLVRRMIEVRFAARRRMRPLAGVITTPSWAAVAVAAVQHLPIGKASIVAMAMTLASPRLAEGGGELSYYRKAREWLTAHLATSADKVEVAEGVTTVTRPAVLVHGVSVSRTAELAPSKRGGAGTGGRHRAAIGVVGDFVYHYNDRWGDSQSPRFIAKLVLAEYRKHREAMAEELRASAVSQALASAIEAGTVVVLAVRQDSYDAGNCEPGTAAFLQSQGWTAKRHVSAVLLLGSGNSRAVAAGRIALKRAGEWLMGRNISIAA